MKNILMFVAGVLGSSATIIGLGVVVKCVVKLFLLGWNTL